MSCLLCILISQAFPFLLAFVKSTSQRHLGPAPVPWVPLWSPTPSSWGRSPNPSSWGKRTYLYDFLRCHSSVLIIRQRAVQCLLLLCACCVDVQPSDHHSSSPVAPFSLLIGVPEGSTVRSLQWHPPLSAPNSSIIVEQPPQKRAAAAPGAHTQTIVVTHIGHK